MELLITIFVAVPCDSSPCPVNNLPGTCYCAKGSPEDYVCQYDPSSSCEDDSGNTTNVKNMYLHRDSNPGPWNTVPML